MGAKKKGSGIKGFFKKLIHKEKKAAIMAFPEPNMVG